MTLSLAHLWFLTSAVLAVGLSAFVLVKRRQERDFGQFSEQIRRLTAKAGSKARLKLGGKPQSLEMLGAAVNQLLDTLERRGADLQSRDMLFQRLVETVHDAVLVHRNQIIFANLRFLALLGKSSAEVVGRPLSDFVGPEYVDLVDANLKRRLAGEGAAERYEVELIGAHGEVTRVELSSAVIDRDGEAALLLTALEMLPEAVSAKAPAARPRAVATLDAMGESVLTVDANGRIDYVNHSAEQLLGQRLGQVVGKTFPDVASLVDENDRHLLGDPVRMALTAGGRVTMGRRAVLVPVSGTAERSVELSVTPLKAEGNETTGLVLVLHDTSELRGLTRQMTYQASHDALTGLVNRREFERRLQEALDSAQTGDAAHALCYLDLDRFKTVNDTCGHTAGDNLLREVASIIKDAVRDSDTAGRIGGDEFALLLIGCPLEKARQIADDVVRSVSDYRFIWKDKIFLDPVFEKMLSDARAHKFDALVVWSVDRFSRGGAGSCFAALGQIDQAGVDFISVQEGYLDTSGPFRDVLVAFAATVARLERERLVSRTLAGLARARAQGRIGGRPRKHLPLIEAAVKHLDGGASYDEVKLKYDVAPSTLRRYRAALKKGCPETPSKVG